MPKMKTHTGMGKRVKVTGRGKLTIQQCNLRHNLEKKPSRVTRRLTGRVEVSAADRKRVRILLGR